MKTYYLLTLGCQMNHSDSERIGALLSSLGLKSAPEGKADLIIVNSCSVRQKPIDRIWGKLKVWKMINLKAKRILTGCVLENDLMKLNKEFDFCFKIEDLESFELWLENYFSPNNVAKKMKYDNYLEIKPKRLQKKIAYVPIMSGCNNFCSYCAVPYTRGKEWSRNPEAVIREVECLVNKGYKRILLLGQNVNSYKILDDEPDLAASCEVSGRVRWQSRSSAASIGLHPRGLPRGIQAKSNKKGDGFVKLMKKLIEIPGRFRIYFMSPHPKDFSDELIELIAKKPKISKEIHLPMQSGDDKILKKMNRGYTASDYLELIEKMRKKIKGLRISTDIIVGFPGETEQNFRNTVKLVKSSNISKAYISIYSPRTGTLAQKKYADSIPLKIKKKRWLALENLINKKTKRKR
ncbi:MAG: radical SAM protein [Candidatus Berkelbacteria bacterium]|nr:radical SAM protein [Candidatus Berkelbacteria bacterium]